MPSAVLIRFKGLSAPSAHPTCSAAMRHGAAAPPSPGSQHTAGGSSLSALTSTSTNATAAPSLHCTAGGEGAVSPTSPSSPCPSSSMPVACCAGWDVDDEPSCASTPGTAAGPARGRGSPCSCIALPSANVCCMRTPTATAVDVGVGARCAPAEGGGRRGDAYVPSAGGRMPLALLAPGTAARAGGARSLSARSSSLIPGRPAREGEGREGCAQQASHTRPAIPSGGGEGEHRALPEWDQPVGAGGGGGQEAHRTRWSLPPPNQAIQQMPYQTHIEQVGHSTDTVNMRWALARLKAGPAVCLTS